MTVPAGIPLTFVFVFIFLFLVLFLACIALAFVTNELLPRLALLASAMVLLVIMGAGAYFTLGSEEEETTEEAKVETVAETPPKPKPEPTGTVVLTVDETTIEKVEDPLMTESLENENPKPGGDKATRDERRKVGRRLASLEKELTERLSHLASQVQVVNQRFESGEIGNYDMLFWKAKIKTQQYGLIVKTMDDKQKILESAAFLTDSDKEDDLAKINRRRELALEKWKEYHGVLNELSANADAFQSL